MNPPPRRRLLFLAQTLPFPPHGGVQIRTYNILRLLATEFDVTALLFARRATHPEPSDLASSAASLGGYGVIKAFRIPQEFRISRLVIDHIRSVVARRPYTVFAYESKLFREALTDLLQSQRFDIVHVDSLDLSNYLSDLTDLPVVCVHHNVESELLRRRSERESLIRRWYMRMQAGFLEKEERRWLPRVALNVAVSDQDRLKLQRMVPHAKFIVVPNGVDTRLFQPGVSGRDGIVFVGGYGWYPNRDALEYFADDILPLLRRARPLLPVRWIGRAPPQIQRLFKSRYDIELTGYVDDIRPLVEEACCYVVPIRVGGGTRLKILDAWALGKAVVSTTIGCEGLDAREGENILIRDSPADFAEAVLNVLDDEDLRRRLETGGRRTVERDYDWEVIGSHFLPSYRALRRT
jgi:polysaccharide biosynthesis protein PslH